MLTFEWDSKKARTNLKKHGISFEEAVTVFGDLLSLTIPDESHSDEEERLIIIGESDRRRLIVVVHTENNYNQVRIISARLATRIERFSYEK